MSESNRAFTRKYRPVDMKSYVGNSVTKKKIQSMFKNGKIPQTLLFEGDRGCGKTTLARIVAKNLLCESPTEEGLACEECKTCKAMTEKYILTGETPLGINIHEIDITKSNSKEDAAKLVEQMRVKPIGNKKKVYILDEIQRASPEAQNSYLKISEEPGSFLYIILCTTNPEDLIDPFKSRFNSLKIRRPGVAEIVERLEEICISEHIKYDESALRLIAINQNRVPRECISKLDMISIGGQVTYQGTVEELQLVSSGLYQKYFEILNRDVYEAMQFIEDLYEEHGVDWKDFLGQLADYTLDVFNMKLGMRLDKYTEDEYKSARQVMKNYSAKDIGRFLGLIEEALAMKENPRYALTMLTLKMGYEDYLRPITTSEVKEDVKKEENIAVRAYQQKKEKQLKHEAKLRLEEQTTSIEDIMNLLPGSKMIDVGPVDRKIQETKSVEKSEDDFEGEKSIDFNDFEV